MFCILSDNELPHKADVMLCTAGKKNVVAHPLWLRLCHWVNAVAIVLMIMSGWRIFNASPLFNFIFPDQITIGGWLGGALQWHFAAMWLFGINGLIYILMNIITGRLKKRFWPLNFSGFYKDTLNALKGRLGHADIYNYNMVQKYAYLSMIFSGVMLVMSGLVMWKSVQFPLIRTLFFGYDTARYIHFFSMAFICMFVVIHLVMVILVPKTLILMIRGRAWGNHEKK